MGKKTPKAPTPADPVALAAAQGQANKDAIRESAKVNAVDIFGPDGSTTYNRNPDGTPMAQVTTLNPVAQQAYNGQQQIALDLTGRAQNAVNAAPNTPFTLNGVPFDPRNFDASQYGTFNANSFARPGGNTSAVGASGGTQGGGNAVWGQNTPLEGTPSGNSNGVWSMTQNPGELPYDPRSYGDVGQINQGAADNIFNEGMRRMTPQFDQQRMRLEQNLHDRGIPITSEAARTATADLDRNQNDAITGLTGQAYDRGFSVAGENIAREQNLRGTAVGEALQFHNQANQDLTGKLQLEQNLRGQVIGEDNMVRNTSINDAMMYLQGAPAINQPNAPNVPTYQQQAVDHVGINNQVWGQQMQNYQNQVANNNSVWQGIGTAASLGARMWMASSSTFKDNVGEPSAFLDKANALKIRSWDYTPESGHFDGRTHIGPFAEEWSEAFGGPRDSIHLGDAIFVLWKAFQELSTKVRKLEATQ